MSNIKVHVNRPAICFLKRFLIPCLIRVRHNFDLQHPIIDPDPGKCYSKAKRMKCDKCCEEREAESSTEVSQASKSDLVENWSSGTSYLPKKFSYINIVNHAKKSGRNSSSYVEKPLEKGYKFFYENYVHDVLMFALQNEVHIKGKCYRSQKKSLSPHSVVVKLAVDGNVINGKCSCVAGANGYCNHTMALLYLIDHTIKIKAKSFPVVGTCTDNPQQWHKPRTQGIHPDPIMGYTVTNPKYGAKKSGGVKCTLYEARQPVIRNNEGAIELQYSLAEINPALGFCTVFSDSPSTKQITLNDSKVPVGSALSYQLSLTEGNFQVITNFPPLLTIPGISIQDNFPSLPYDKEVIKAVGLQMPLNVEESQFIDNLQVTNPSYIEENTRGQSDNLLWFNVRKHRLTSSNFGQVCKRKTGLSQTKFVDTLLTHKDLSNVSSIKYGKDNEAKAADKYVNYMKASGNPVKISESGVIVCQQMPWLAASPDRKVIDKGYGLVEIKCPYTLRNLTPEEACKEPTFYCDLINGKPQLQRSHIYYYQIQGQLGICGLKWCDFVCFFTKGLIIERVQFDEHFWEAMITKLTAYYQQHIMHNAMKL